MLTLRYMVENSPWKDKDMPGIYFAEPHLDHYPPIFDFGVALTMPEILDFAVKKGIIEKLPASDDDMRRLPFNVQEYFNEKFGFKSMVQFGMPQIASKERLFSFGVWTNYKCCVSESKKLHVVEVMKQEFDVEDLTWFISYMNEGLKSHYTVPEDKFLAFLAAARR
ncbi:hypothetical protein E1B28_003132 [Marasmius oreades]|uniref:Uncharacterized protein n=1 Tax=Marasmius oreades TaxID=181124 RepID=A0A9P7ULZ4_9AGAR|nr:uncharacterized protein E1B28_003132 [Marasmius oreades]KAG7085576.1 hypothetical protein E1B28_003132 [Marasmius oreades]